MYGPMALAVQAIPALALSVGTATSLQPLPTTISSIPGFSNAITDPLDRMALFETGIFSGTPLLPAYLRHRLLFYCDG